MDRLISGISASPGFAVGECYLLHRGEPVIEERTLEADEIETEVERFRRALETARKEVTALQRRISRTMGEEGTRIFGVQLMILQDEMVVDATILGIRESRRNADAVFSEIMCEMRDHLAAASDEYLAQRAMDIDDVRRRVLAQLAPGGRLFLRQLRRPVVVVAQELTPSETALLDPERVLAFVTEAGGRTSHAAIMARSLGVPAVVGVSRITERFRTGTLIAVDGTSGQVAVNPDERLIKFFESQKAIFAELERELLKLKNLPAVTLDGREVELSANIEMPDEVERAISFGARGIGLLRTEYLYLDRGELPGEEEQYTDYRDVLERISPDTAIIRTFDLGGDKVGAGPVAPLERNPFLGWRAIRVSLAEPDIFQTQLRAILRASAHGRTKLLFPMIASLEELRQAKAALELARASLRTDGVAFDEEIPVGIMMEVPAACAIAELLAREADFLSIGTNDLIQYSLAVDRGNPRVAYIYQELHPAILRQIKMTIDAGHKYGRWVGMCGEMSANPLATMILLGLGLDEFSMSPALLPEIKKIIRSCTHAEAKACAGEALEQETVEEVLAVARRYTKGKLGDLETDVIESVPITPTLQLPVTGKDSPAPSPVEED